jgi:hypothetical protein
MAPIAVVAYAVPGAWGMDDQMLRVAAQAINYGGSTDWSNQWDIAKNAASGGPVAGCTAYSGFYASMIVCTATARDARVDADELVDRLTAASAMFWNPDKTLIHEAAAINGSRGALATVVAGLDNMLDTSAGRIATVALNTHFTGDPAYGTKLVNKLLQVDRNDVRPWVQEWLSESRAVSVVIDPRPTDEWLPVSPSSSYHGDLMALPLPTADPPPTNDDVSAAYSALNADKIREITLKNGLKVVIADHGDAPTVLTTLVSRGGGAYGKGMDDFATTMMRRLTNDIAEGDAGKRDLDPTNIAGGWQFARSTHLTYEAVSGPAGNLDATLYLLRRNAEARTFNPSAKNRWWRNVRVGLPQAWANRAWWARHLRLQEVVPEHPTTWEMSTEDAERMKAVGGGEVSAWLDRKFSTQNSTLFVVGRIDLDEGEALAQKYWGNWKGGDGAPLDTVPAASKPTGPSVMLLDGPEMNQTVITATCQLAPPEAEMLANQQVLQAMLNETIAGSLAEAGAMPLAGLAQLSTPAPVAWMDTVAAVPHDKVDIALAALEKTLAEVMSGDVDEARMQQHKLRLAGAASIQQLGMVNATEMLAEAWLLEGRGSDWFERYGTALAAVDSAAIKRAAGSCADNIVYTI